MYDRRQLAKKGFVPSSAQAELSSPHKPPISCSEADYRQLPPDIKKLYNEEPKRIGRFAMHHKKGK